MDAISVTDLVVDRGRRRVLSGLGFAVPPGQVAGLLGPSGSGKTTVLRIIAGLETPTSGEIYIDGVRVNDLPVQERNIGFVFQHYALFKHMTLFQNVAFGLKVKKWGREDIRARVHEHFRDGRVRPKRQVTRVPRRKDQRRRRVHRRLQIAAAAAASAAGYRAPPAG